MLLRILLRTLLILRCLYVIHGFVISDLIEKGLKSRPSNGNASSSLKVHVGFYLESIGNFRAQEMSFDVDLYVYLSWLDSRLAHNQSKHILVNDPRIREQIWLPDLYFANARQAHFEDVTVPNFNIFIANDGMVAYSCRATCSISCTLQLKKYPMDRQKCYIRVLSYAHIADEVEVSWFSKGPIRYNPEIGLPEFEISRVDESYCNGTYRYALTEYSHKIGNFSCLMGNIYLTRSIGYNLVQSYIPTGLIVMISWVSFWIDRKAVPARVTVSFTTLVSLTTLGSGLRFGLPQVSYAKAIDYWFGACMFFVICALLEYALVNTYMRKSERFQRMSTNLVTQSKSRRGAVASTQHFDSSEDDEGEADSPVKKVAEALKTTLSPKTRQRGYKPVPNGSAQKENGDTRLQMINEAFTAEIHNDGPASERNGRLQMSPIPILRRGNTMDQSYYDNVTPRRSLRNAYDESPPPLYSNALADSVSERDSGAKANGSSKKKKKAVFLKREPSRNGGSPSVLTVTAASYSKIASGSSRHALLIDKTCRFLFPVMWCIFNFIYWWYYLVYDNKELH